MDLVVVSVSFVCETILEDLAKGLVPLMIVLRLWKVAAFVFDTCLADTEDTEMDKKVYDAAGNEIKKPKKQDRNHNGITGKMSASPDQKRDAWQKDLGEFMESP